MKPREPYNSYSTVYLTKLEAGTYKAETEEYLLLEESDPNKIVLSYNVKNDQFYLITYDEDEDPGDIRQVPRVHVLSEFAAADLPEKFLKGITLEDAEFMSLDWGDCLPVCYDDKLTIDDIADSNGWLLWSGDSSEDLMLHDEEAADYLIPRREEKT